MSLFNQIAPDFPMLKVKLNEKRLVYLDSAATALKPQPVIDAITDYYTNHCGTVHRSIHALGEFATNKYEATRDKVQHLINAAHREEIIFTKGTTESLNLLARILGDASLKPGDEIITTEAEHHSNLVPWQLLAERNKLKLKFIPMAHDGSIEFQKLSTLLSEKTKVVTFTGQSNVLGTATAIKEIVSLIKKYRSDILTIVDAAQLVCHQRIDVQDLGVDFLAFSGHKFWGPTGIGILYGKKMLLEQLPPFQGGGDMIDHVTLEKTTFNDLPYKFEAGTPSIAAVIGLGAAVDYIEKLTLSKIHQHIEALSLLAHEKLASISNVEVYSKPGTPLLSFNIKNMNNHDLASTLSMEGIALRTGHLCAQPLLKNLKQKSIIRASLSLYNNEEDISALITGLQKSINLLS